MTDEEVIQDGAVKTLRHLADQIESGEVKVETFNQFRGYNRFVDEDGNYEHKPDGGYSLTVKTQRQDPAEVG